MAIQGKAAGTGFAGEDQPAPTPELPQRAVERGEITADTTVVANLAARGGVRQRGFDRFLVDIQADVHGMLVHGLPARMSVVALCQRCGSVRLAHNPRYRGGRSPESSHSV